jgi:hypothetical protein
MCFWKWLLIFFFFGNVKVFFVLCFCKKGYFSYIFYLIWIVTYPPVLISTEEVALCWKRNNLEVFLSCCKNDFFFFFFFWKSKGFFLCFCKKGYFSYIFYLIWIVTHPPVLISTEEVTLCWKRNNWDVFSSCCKNDLIFFFFLEKQRFFLCFCKKGYFSYIFYLIWIVTHPPVLISTEEVALCWKRNNLDVFVKRDIFHIFVI